MVLGACNAAAPPSSKPASPPAVNAPANAALIASASSSSAADAGALAPSADAGAGADALPPESPDPHPDAGTVSIKLIVDQKKKARVYWGRKDLGLAPLELQRPRNSGPLDLVVVAPGYLPLHTRVFTDRDDKLALRLYSESEAPSILGYDRRP